MSIQIPRTNAPIGSSGFNFTPDQFPRWVAFIAAQLEALESGGAGGLNPLITGYGRITGADYFGADLTAPRLPSSPALALEIPNSTWFVEDRIITIDEPGGFLLLGDLPANMAGKYGYVSAYEVEDSGGQFSLEIRPENWFEALQPALFTAGLACIGKITTDADSVRIINGSQADVIVPLWVLLRQIKVLGGGGGSGEEGEEPATGAVTRAEFNLALARISALEGALADILAKIAKLGGAADLFPPPFTQMADEIAISRAGLAEVNRHAIERGQISVVVKQAGHGQFDTPDYTPDTNSPLEVPWHADSGTFGP